MSYLEPKKKGLAPPKQSQGLDFLGSPGRIRTNDLVINSFRLRLKVGYAPASLAMASGQRGR